MFNKIRIQEEHSSSDGTSTWPLPVCDFHIDSSAGLNGYLLKSADGIGPPEFVSTVEGFDSNGVPVYEGLPQTREVVLTIALKRTKTNSVYSLRNALQKFIARSINLYFMDGGEIVARAKGFVSKFESTHFSNIPEIQMTIVCEHGELYAPTFLDIPVACYNTLTPIIPYNEGDAPTGLKFQFEYISVTPGTGFTISDYSKLWYKGTQIVNVFELAFPFEQGDIITFDSCPYTKKLTLLRDSETIDIAGYIVGSPIWPKLFPGVNSFTWDISSTWADWIYCKYDARFWGV